MKIKCARQPNAIARVPMYVVCSRASEQVASVAGNRNPTTHTQKKLRELNALLDTY
jgi:hypothetical protein